MTAASTLEKQLLDYWRELETLKTWSEWATWFASFEDTFTLGDAGVGSTVKINYLKFLSLWEYELENHSGGIPQKWKKQLTNPRWLQKQKIIVLPSNWSEDTEHSLDELGSLREQVSELSTELNQLRQQVITLENKWSSIQQNVVQQNISQRGASTSLTAGHLNSGGAAIQPRSNENNRGNADKKESDEWGELRSSQMLGQAIVKKQSKIPSKKGKKSIHQKDENLLPEIKPLEEVYLSFDEWIERFRKDGFMLQELLSSTTQKDGRSPQGMPSESARPISFQQFQRRITRYIEKTAQFEETVRAFSESYVQGFPISDKASQYPSEETLNNEMSMAKKKSEGTPSFEKPSDDVYLGFNDWIAWFKDRGLDPQNFTSNELKGSSRRISYIQFCKRLERQLDDVETFQKALQIAEKS